MYANTGHRHMVEVCVQELGKLPGPELENAMDRESYSLTAGLALGIITMGQGCIISLSFFHDKLKKILSVINLTASLVQINSFLST